MEMDNNKKHMRRCAVCKNRHNYKTFKFFKTPVCPMKRQRWIDACGVNFRDNDLICQNHFAEQDFINGPGCSGIIRLQPGAVPQVRAPTPDTSSIEPPVDMKEDAPYKKYSTRSIEKTPREMEQLQFCRICAKCSKSGHSNKLFGDDTQKLIKKIEDITGIRLVNSKPFPQYICKSCEADLEKAHEFRERCIFSQEYFNTLEFKKELNETKRRSVSPLTNNELDIKDELPLEECELVEMSNMKEESSDAFFLDGDEFSTSNGKCEEEMVNNFTEDGDEVTANTPHTSPIKKEQIQKSKHIAKKQVAQSKTTKIFNSTRSKIAKAARKTGVKSQTFICDQCGNYFTCKHHFVTHLRRHTGDKRHQCELCPDRFFTNSELNRHMRKHTGERPFACKHCGRRFTDYSTRIKHERTHTNERPFVCLQCTKAFTTSYILKNHMLVHTGERSFRCDLCNRSFQRQTHLAVHARSIMHKQNEEKQRQKDNKVPATEHTINEANY